MTKMENGDDVKQQVNPSHWAILGSGAALMFGGGVALGIRKNIERAKEEVPESEA